MAMARWRFYGRSEQLAHFKQIFERGRWFFVQVSGRRRIGKTALLQEALRGVDRKRRKSFYVQIPDADLTGVLPVFCEAMEAFHVPADRFPLPRDAASLAATIEAMAEAGWRLVLDEFQYFNRKGRTEFCSHLQAAVDRLSAKADQVPGGLVAMGSIHTEMEALLEDRSAPLYHRTTDSVELSHLDVGSLLTLLRDHVEPTPQRLLFLWNLFEGVPKFYRDCYEQGVLGADREALLRRIFFESSSPLRNEAQHWFLRELHGRYDVLLKEISRHPGRTHAELVQTVDEAGGGPKSQASGYLDRLIDRFRLVERKLPVFAPDNARRGRYYLADNFLRSWLAALAGQVGAAAFLPMEEAVRTADERLAEAEGWALEKLVGQLYEERSRRGLGDFPLSRRIAGWWDKSGVEIDLVAVDERNRAIRFGTCKRSPKKLLSDAPNFLGHVDRFLSAWPQYQSWKVDYVGVAPELDLEQRAVLRRFDLLGQDLNDLTAGLE